MSKRFTVFRREVLWQVIINNKLWARCNPRRTEARGRLRRARISVDPESYDLDPTKFAYPGHRCPRDPWCETSPSRRPWRWFYRDVNDQDTKRFRQARCAMRRRDYTGKTCRSWGGSHVDVISSEFTVFTPASLLQLQQLLVTLWAPSWRSAEIERSLTLTSVMQT